MLGLLPPLIYFAAFSMSWQAFRHNLSPIALLAVGCVLATTLVVGLVSHQLLGLPLAVAFMLGAIVSPPDVLAPLAVAQRLGIPRRLSAILEGEGLVNDATALILFNLALAAALTGQFSAVGAVRDFVLVLVGETAWGFVVGFIGLHARHLVREPRIEVMISFLTPYAAFWLPHAVGGSGVLAAVVAGLYTGSAGVALIRANTRLQALFFWDVVNTVITGLIFLLTGLQARTVVAGLEPETLVRLGLFGLLISAVVIVVRFAWVFVATYLPYALRRTPREDDPVPSWQQPFIVAFTGVRGVVSLVAALSIPVAVGVNVGFPGRDRVLVVTFVVIIVTLVAQGLTLPWVVRRLGLDRHGARRAARPQAPRDGRARRDGARGARAPRQGGGRAPAAARDGRAVAHAPGAAHRAARRCDRAHARPRAGGDHGAPRRARDGGGGARAPQRAAARRRDQRRDPSPHRARPRPRRGAAAPQRARPGRRGRRAGRRPGGPLTRAARSDPEPLPDRAW